jgi:hypothetical protein
MKKVFLFFTPFLIAVLIFFGILFFMDQKSGKGALQVTSIPKSKVYLNGKLVGTTKFCTCEASQMLPPGDYDLKLVSTEGNFGPFEEKITINKSTLTAVDKTFADDGEGEGSIISLSPLNEKKDVELLVISLPDKANVFLDSNPVGVTPLLLKQVSESDHDLRLTREGYKSKSIRIKTALGFQLNSLIFLGVKSDLSASSSALIESLPLATSSASILILDTPTGFLRVRANNSVNSSEIAQVKPGESYELLEGKGEWFKIRLANGKEGWISSSYAVKK